MNQNVLEGLKEQNGEGKEFGSGEEEEVSPKG